MGGIQALAQYITIFFFELISAYVLWLIFKKMFRTTKLYRIAMICLVVSLAVGYIASYRMVGYEVTMGYLTEINNQKIELTGKSITPEEENAYKEALFQRKDFKKILITSSIKISLIPFILVVLIMLFSARRSIKNLPPKKALIIDS